MYITVLVVALLSGIYLALTPGVYAAPMRVYCEPSDGYVRDGIAEQFDLLKAGDGALNYCHKIFVKFRIPSEGTIISARLYLYAHSSRRNGNTYSASPLPNPDLGDLVVYHVNDYGDLDPGNFDAVSIDHDPGVLIPDGETVNVGYISIDITDAMQDDVDNGRRFTTYMIRMQDDTDGDSLDDFWRFCASRHPDEDTEPYIEFTISIPVGGTMTGAGYMSVLVYVAIALGVFFVGGALIAFRRRLQPIS